MKVGDVVRITNARHKMHQAAETIIVGLTPRGVVVQLPSPDPVREPFTAWEFDYANVELVEGGYDWYISARYGRRAEAEILGHILLGLGHRVTSRWIWRDQPANYGDASDAEVASYAIEDIEDVNRATHFISLSEPADSPWGRGSRHVESGLALARTMPWAVIGPRENVFHYLPHVVHFESVEDFISVVKEGF